jgi:hydroxypyruvate isomerase
MPKFNANLTFLYTEAPFLERFGRAAASGFRGVEYLFPYAHPKDAIAERLEKHKLEQVLFDLPAGNWDAGERGIAVLPDRVGEFQDGVALAIDYAKALRCTRLTCLAGKTPAGIPADRIHRTLVENLRFAAKALGDAGIRLLVEPINTLDIPGFHLTRTRDTLAVLEEVGHPNAWLQYDIYHMQIMEGNLTRTIREHLPRIPHMQLADNPGRNQPGTGEINFPNLFRAIDAAGYDGWIGCEYKPTGRTEDSLDWVRPYLT